jgi:hypothetical protein
VRENINLSTGKYGVFEIDVVVPTRPDRSFADAGVDPSLDSLECFTGPGMLAVVAAASGKGTKLHVERGRDARQRDDGMVDA